MEEGVGGNGAGYEAQVVDGFSKILSDEIRGKSGCKGLGGAQQSLGGGTEFVVVAYIGNYQFAGRVVVGCDRFADYVDQDVNTFACTG